MQPFNTRKREWELKGRAFPFEAVHIDEPANNMSVFHWHEFLELSYTMKGSGVYEIEGKTFPVRKGDIIIINNIERHRVTYCPEDPLYETVIHFDPALIWSKENSPFDYNYLRLFLYNGVSFNNKPELEEDDRNAVAMLISEIAYEFVQKKPYYELMIKSKLLTTITILIRGCNVRHTDESDFIARRNNIDRLEKVLKYINENFHRDISLESTAKEFFMNTSYFSDYFKKNVGVNFSEYLTKARINEAIRLINMKGSTSTEIAFACGFNNTSSFFNAFKRVTGMNPGEYKKSRR